MRGKKKRGQKEPKRGIRTQRKKKRPTSQKTKRGQKDPNRKRGHSAQINQIQNKNMKKEAMKPT